MTSVFDLAPDGPVVPVVVIEDAADAVPLARALVAGGLPLIEVTLRTPAALDAVRALPADVPVGGVGGRAGGTAAGGSDAGGARARWR
ncbi:keto-deoxy-phosphogluconate aldolase, partial [Streptomyces sp. NPDC057540]